MTFIYKRVFPVLWFGFLGLFLAIGLLKGDLASGVVPLFVAPGLMALVGFVVIKRLVWDLADEVHDGGDFLLIKKGGEEHRVPLGDIVNVSAATMMNPPRISLRLAGMTAAGSLGSEVVFSPEKPLSLNPFARNAVAEDLIARVARSRHPD
jgi:hypothetical protein